jgi:serine/threonine protein kinase
VLFSERDDCWKLTDFGSASLATSKGFVTTAQARGTASYRAPEVILQSKCNNRSDIFALGCMIFELITTTRLFPHGDWEVQEYAKSGIPVFPERWPAATQGSRLHSLGQLASTSLSAEPRERLGAAELRRQLLRLRTVRSDSAEEDAHLTSDDDFFDLDNSDVHTTPSNPTVQSGLRFLGETRRGGLLFPC